MTTIETKRPKRGRLSQAEREARNLEALGRARGGLSIRNDAIAEEWARAQGYPNPQARVNLLTYHAWRALGRQVRKGEHGCELLTWIPIRDKTARRPDDCDDDAPKRLRPKTTYVFHEAQTDAVGA